LIKGFSEMTKSFFNLLKIIFLKPLKTIGIFIYRLIIINFYKLYLLLKKAVRKIFPAEKIKPVYLFINRYLPHLIITLLVTSIGFANILTKETRAESFGEKSFLYALATGKNIGDEYIEERLEATLSKTTDYMGGETAAVAAPQKILTAQELAPEETFLTLTAEGTALVKPEIASIEASKIQRDKTIEYAVKEGDTIGSIAQNFNITSETILWENNLNKSSIIKPGQILRILPTSGISYKIASGDTLDKIARKYKAEKEKIIEFNKLANERDIQIGQNLIIPGGQAYYAPPPTPARLAPIQQIFQPVSPVTPSDPTKMLWPTSARHITQYFNWRHIGLDIAGPFGTPIWAAESGTVSKVAFLNYGYGYHVIIGHGGGKSTLYGHFQKIYVKEGQKVDKGEVLGEMGSTGYSTGSHLHFEVRFGNTRYNPLNYIK